MKNAKPIFIRLSPVPLKGFAWNSHVKFGIVKTIFLGLGLPGVRENYMLLYSCVWTLLAKTADYIHITSPFQGVTTDHMNLCRVYTWQPNTQYRIISYRMADIYEPAAILPLTAVRIFHSLVHSEYW